MTVHVTFSSKWNPKRQEVTYRLGKRGTSVFLLLGADDIAELHRQITKATEGLTHDNTHC